MQRYAFLKDFFLACIADGFPDRGAYHMLEDKRGRIWFMTFSGKTCYYESGGFHSPVIPFHIKNDFVRWIEEMPDGRLLFLTNKGDVIMQWPDGHFRNYPVCKEALYHGLLFGADSLIIASDYYLCLHLPTGKQTFNVGLASLQLAPGIYIVRVSTGTNEFQRKLIVRECMS